VEYKIYESSYKDKDAISMESENVIVQFLPEFGGKMASLIHKKTLKEFLVQGENEKYKVLDYNGNYVDAECSGFDDMFPTIDTVYYADYPWAGTKLPEHGEICGLKWDYAIESDCMHMWVYGVRLPYKFEKRIIFISDNKLSIDYKVTNLSSFNMDFLWAAHSMINVEENGEIMVPFLNNEDITCVFSQDDGFGAYGDKMTWYNAERKDGSVQKLNITPKRNQKGNNYKFYFDKKMPEGWCSYKYNKSNLKLTLSFPIEKVPYLSIWINEGSFHGFNNIALEPCTGAYDRPDIAKLHGQNSILKAKSEYSWFLNFDIENLK
jgi:galactose mutarotase-like enzyme